MDTNTKLNSKTNSESIAKSVKKATTKKAVNAPAKKKAPKKTVKKAPVKAKKKVAKKSVKKQILPEQHFYLNDGQSIKDIRELAKIMDDLSDELFSHHVNDDRHDFANWINDVFEEAELARQLLESERQKEKNHYIVLKYVVKGK